MTDIDLTPSNTITILGLDGQAVLTIASDGSVTASENFRASEAAEQFLDALTDIVAERDRLRRVVYDVATAWTKMGRVPTYHRKQQIGLVKNWPTLARAVIQAVGHQQRSDNG